ncbi:MAG: PIN domain-containing protein [Calditrichaceae bacterium]|nr:PIN domain-containing protein [Calditrichaceae bacterium]MBN2710013.1 PIN domain-containing protein [Calditrichaceae bacterium]RQV97349.1 MAG: PIN domain-containing protein [Calditrichota bacterium]
MNDKYFIDTNILVYSFNKKDEQKQNISQKIINDALEYSNGIISFQVVQEFLNVALRKFSIPLTFEDCVKYLNIVLEPLCEISPDMDLYRHALQISERWRYSFYDSLIISAAIKGDCKILYSEDLQHKQSIGNLVILNPFIELK